MGTSGRGEQAPMGRRPWFAIGWFALWGLFQAVAVILVFNGTWERPQAFPPVAYESMAYADVFFVPLYLSAAVLLFRRHWMGAVFALIAGGGAAYAMIYLLALSGFSGPSNLIADSVFLICTVVSMWQVGGRVTSLSGG